MSQPPLPFDDVDARDAAMAQVEANAEESAPGFSEQAQAFIIDFLRRHGSSTGERLTDACKAAGLVPHDDRAFGPVLMKLARAGQIRKAGFAPRRKGHGTAGGNVWELKVEKVRQTSLDDAQRSGQIGEEDDAD